MANSIASSKLTGFVVPSGTGTLCFLANFFDSILSPKKATTSAVGPAYSKPASSTFYANTGFSLKNP